MEKAIIKELEPLLPKLLLLSKRKKSVWFDYDDEADVLYVSFDKPQKATDTEIVNDDILIRRRDKTIVGVTFLHASNYAN